MTKPKQKVLEAPSVIGVTLSQPSYAVEAAEKLRKDNNSQAFALGHSFSGPIPGVGALITVSYRMVPIKEARVTGYMVDSGYLSVTVAFDLDKLPKEAREEGLGTGYDLNERGEVVASYFGAEVRT